MSTQNNPSDIERVVMRRVHTIRTLRPVFSGGGLAALFLVVALWGIGREVWVARVFENGPHSLAGHTEYLAYAFVHTRIIVQALTLTTLASLLYLAREVAGILTRAIIPRQA